jgi:hypothetical protein
MTTASDPFAAVRLNKQTQAPTTAQQVSQQEEDPFSGVRINPAGGFPFIKEAGRHAVRVGSRIAETIGGIPGDIGSLLESGMFYGMEKLTGKPVPEATRKLVEQQRKYPTSAELKKKSEAITGGFTAPQGPIEKSIDEGIETAAALLGPMKFRKALGVAVGSQAAKEGLKIAGVGEGTQEAGKLGTMFLLSVINPGGAMRYTSSQFKKADALAKDAIVNASHFENSLKDMLSGLEKGITTPGKNAVVRPVEELLKKIKGGNILVQDLTAAKRDINTLMGDPTLLEREKKMFKGLAEQVDKAIAPYEKINPAFSKAYRPANEIFGAVMQGNKAFNLIKKTLGGKSVVGATLAEIALGHPEAILPTIGIGAGVVGAARSYDFFTRLMRSPELRKFYGKALAAAAAEDVPSLRTYAEKIEDILD